MTDTQIDYDATEHHSRLLDGPGYLNDPTSVSSTDSRPPVQTGPGGDFTQAPSTKGIWQLALFVFVIFILFILGALGLWQSVAGILTGLLIAWIFTWGEKNLR